jgi:hypothetical protein
MAFKKGQPRPENAGRKKGSVNKKTHDARELAERLGVDPLEILFHFASRNWKALGYNSEYMTKVLKDGGTLEVERITPEMRLNAAKEAVRYVYPQTKAVELKNGTEDAEGFKIILEDYTSEK